MNITEVSQGLDTILVEEQGNTITIRRGVKNRPPDFLWQGTLSQLVNVVEAAVTGKTKDS